MTLVRLSRYLRSLGYTVKVDDQFRCDADYQKKCEAFEKCLGTSEALPGTAYTDFLLIKVYKDARVLCQILEAPGEHYFDPDNVKASNFPQYMIEMIHSSKNRKIWAFITEAKWTVTPDIRNAYVDRIKNCKQMLVHDTDRFVVLYNKIDKRNELYINGHLQVKSAEDAMRSEYVGLAEVFRNDNLFTSLWRPYDYLFVPFCTGHYNKEDNKLKYTPSADSYPKSLWKALLKSIRG
jgi:hypothetical protein